MKRCYSSTCQRVGEDDKEKFVPFDRILKAGYGWENIVDLRDGYRDVHGYGNSIDLIGFRPPGRLAA